jgi:hypothetical protein
MNFEVHFSSAAQADIDQIFDYISIALCSPVAAKNLMAKFQESGITAYFIMSIMTCRKSLYCVSFIADKKRSSHNAYLKKFSGRNRLYL